jgi:hypothetical protein
MARPRDDADDPAHRARRDELLAVCQDNFPRTPAQLARAMRRL